MSSRVIPLLGALILLGVIVNIVLGFSVADGYEYLRDTHIGIGYVGLILVLITAIVAWRRWGKVPGRNVISVTVVLILAVFQVYLGTQIVTAPTQTFIILHETTAFLLLISVVATAVLTSRR